MKPPERFLVRRIEARRIFGGMAERTFTKLEADGILVAKKRGKPGVPSIYDLHEIVPAYIAYARTTAPSGGDKEARARRDQSQAELNELRLAEHQRELLPRDDVVRDGQAFITAAKAKILGLPRRMVQAGQISREMQQAVAGLLLEALEEMARWKTYLDLLEAAKSGR